jgi:CheY-like chemotaxis protein
VTDTGIGVNADQLSKLFSMFTQAGPNISAKFGGTGLGLALSRTLCRVMGGDITMTSEPGKGSCFTIVVPVAITGPFEDVLTAPEVEFANAYLPQPPDAITVSAVSVPLGRRILLVDDDRSFLEIAERMLNKEGFSPICTDQSASAAHLARTIKPDMILLDILMPDVDGWSVLRALKRDPATAAIPVIMLSVVDDRKRAIEFGAIGIVSKPLQRSELLRMVNAARSGGDETLRKHQHLLQKSAAVA